MFDMIANYYSNGAAIAAVCFFWTVSLFGFSDSQLESATRISSFCEKTSQLLRRNFKVGTEVTRSDADERRTRECVIELSKSRLLL